MVAVAIVLATTLAGALGLLAWLVRGRVVAADQLADARVGQVATEAELERSGFELDIVKKALAASQKRADALERVIADEINDSESGLPLDRNGVRQRIVQIARQWAEADRARALPARSEPGELLAPAVSSAGSPGPVVRPGDD